MEKIGLFWSVSCRYNPAGREPAPSMTASSSSLTRRMLGRSGDWSRGTLRRAGDAIRLGWTASTMRSDAAGDIRNSNSCRPDPDSIPRRDGGWHPARPHGGRPTLVYVALYAEIVELILSLGIQPSISRGRRRMGPAALFPAHHLRLWSLSGVALHSISLNNRLGRGRFLGSVGGYDRLGRDCDRVRGQGFMGPDAAFASDRCPVVGHETRAIPR